MSREQTGERWPGAGEPPTEVEVTLLGREEPPLARRVVAGLARGIRARWRAVGATALVAISAGALSAGLVAGAAGGRRGSRSVARPVSASLPGAAGVAAAYGYPTRCIVVTIAPDGTFARADFSHTNVCGRYAGDPTAIFRRVGGRWHAVLDAVAYPCPVEAIPGVVQRQLSVCP